ncbi:MAG: Gfo/Idh/MocA family oxidoreductase [Candidatus Solibacter usitatus]|nr:Gfo/Idh/MocA family oxidoreductase [Candidatus Solibacter usitatus]
MNPPSERRTFLKAGLAGFPALLKGAPDSKAIKVGLVGCGGRGTGAAAQALKADDYAELTAVADIAQERVDQCLTRLRRQSEPKVKVEPDHQFLGLDAYRRLIESGVDVVLLATPPGFRPLHLRAAIEAGKHVFCEKPIAVDAPGVRSVLETAALAKTKNLSLVTGFCWRYSNFIRETFQQVHDGAIGPVTAYYATYYTSPVKPMPPADTRPAGMSDVQWQIANWYNFCWLSGDGLVEQAVHSVDKIAWAMHDQPPLSCVATGGRQIAAQGGNIYDHFQVNYEYPNGVRAFLGCRQQANCHNENADYILGAKGVCTIGRGPIPRISGEKSWSFEGVKNDMYQAEHDALFAAIRQGKPVNDGVWMATSTMLAMMGRMAAYTGQQITWEQAMNSQEKIFPEKLEWEGSLPPAPLPMPGSTRFL